MNRKKIEVSIVIPNWNGAFLLRKNLPKVIEAKRNQANNIIEIIVVDDSSTDNSIELLEREFNKEVRLVKHKVNRRFAAAVNTGVRFASGSHVCLLNTDVIPEANFLEGVIPHLAKKEVFGVTMHEKGYGPASGVFDGYLKHAGGAEDGAVAETLWISGGSGVFSKTIWKALKGLDGKLYTPFYWEDVDIGYRAHKRGYTLLWEPSAVVEHKHESINSTFNKKYVSLIKERNELLFIWKNITSRNLINKHKKALFNRLIEHPGYLKVVLAAALKWRIVLRKRKKEIEESTVSDEVIFTKFVK